MTTQAEGRASAKQDITEAITRTQAAQRCIERLPETPNHYSTAEHLSSALRFLRFAQSQLDIGDGDC
jgi:hypothetical protein